MYVAVESNVANGVHCVCGCSSGMYENSGCVMIIVTCVYVLANTCSCVTVETFASGAAAIKGFLTCERLRRGKM